MGSEIINHVSVREPGLRGRCWQRCARRAGAELWDLGMGGLWGLWWELWGVEVGSCGGVRWQLWDVWWGAFGIWEFWGMCGEEFWGCAMGFGSEDAQCRSTQCWELGLIKKSLQDSWRHLLSAATSARVQGHFVGVLRAGARLHITTFLVPMWPRCPGSGCGPGHCCHCCAGSMGSALPRATGIIPMRELEPHLLSPF